MRKKNNKRNLAKLGTFKFSPETSFGKFHFPKYKKFFRVGFSSLESYFLKYKKSFKVSVS